MKNVIKNFAEEIAAEKGYLLINSITKGSNKNPSFEIFIDNKDGISAKDCAEFSRDIKDRLEATEIGATNYQLVVSSPGIGEPIKYLDQYYKHVEREFIFSYFEDEKVNSIEAKLLRIDGDDLFFSYKNEELKVNINNIKKAKVKISF